RRRPREGWTFGNRLLRHHQVARADAQDFLPVAEHRPALFVDSDPRAADSALADDAGDAVAGLVNAQRAPFCKNGVTIERPGEAIVEVFDERFGRRGDAAEVSLRHLPDGYGV